MKNIFTFKKIKKKTIAKIKSKSCNRIKYFFPGFCSSGAINIKIIPKISPEKETKLAKK